VRSVAEDEIRSDPAEHVRMIKSFVGGQISAGEFESRYLRLVKNDPAIHGEPAFGIIDELFFHVDEYFDDPDFDEDQRRQEDEKLRSAAKVALDKLMQLAD
jgi:hypothetical protein